MWSPDFSSGEGESLCFPVWLQSVKAHCEPCALKSSVLNKKLGRSLFSNSTSQKQVGGLDYVLGVQEDTPSYLPGVEEDIGV